MSFSNGSRYRIAAVGSAALTFLILVIAFVTAHGDPPVDVAGGSIHGVARPSHIWHQVDSSGESYSISKTADNTQIVITDEKKQILLNCTAAQWVISFYPMSGALVPAAQLCTNNQCVEQDPVDSDGSLYLRTPQGSNKKWKHSWGVKWWNIEHEDGDNIHISFLEMKTAGSSVGKSPCPTSWTYSFPKSKWHVRIGKSEP
jgi:hypothetical protein